MEKNDKVFVAGHGGLVGSAVVRKLRQEGYTNLLLKTRAELDLMNQAAVKDFFNQQRPDQVIVAAAHVGGIMANKTQPADFLYNNLMIQNNVINSARHANVKKLLFLGSSCIYPRDCPQPIKEEYLLSGKLEPTNEGYAIAKIAGLKLCQKIYEQYGNVFLSCMPTNLYGPGDNFDPEQSHVIPGLIRKMHTAHISQAPQVVLWGTGVARREFMHVDDLADAIYFLMQHYAGQETINVGTGEETTIGELAQLIAELVGYEGEVVFNHIHPDGTPRKLLDLTTIHGLGWRHKITFRDGLQEAIEYYLTTVAPTAP